MLIFNHTYRVVILREKGKKVKKKTFKDINFFHLSYNHNNQFL